MLLAGLGAIAFDLVAHSALASESLLPLGAGLVPVGLIVLFLGATRPDPALTTVRGTFGNAEENLLAERLRSASRGRVDPRYLPSPRESVHCLRCYTLIPAQTVMCPRCTERRRCQQCAKPLFFLAGAVRCGPCAKDEVYCDCPRVAPIPSRPRARASPLR